MIFTKHTQHIFSIIQEAMMHGVLSQQRVDFLYREVEALAVTLTKYRNHDLSSSISKIRYEQIWKTINYLFMHGFDESNQDEALLKIQGIAYFYDLGTKKVKQDISKIETILKQCSQSHLRFPNERFHSIIHQQIPDYLETLKGWDEVFHYHHILEDLDYPLFDGLPLFHDMYHLDGTDLVLYYLKRFQLEASFCELFLDHIPALLEDYQNQKGTGVAYLGVNIFELILYQVLGCMLLNQEPDILLSEADVTRLHHQLNAHLDPCSLINQAIERLSDHFHPEIVSYITSFQSTIMLEITRFYLEGYERFIYPIVRHSKTIMKLDMAKADASYQQDLEYLQSCLDFPSKIQYIQAQQLSIYDLIDLLENGVFIDYEYREFFESLTTQEIAVMINVLNPSLAAFHQQWHLDDQLFDELDLDNEWAPYFVASLRDASMIRKEEIEQTLNHLVIR